MLPVSTDFPTLDGIAPSWADLTCKLKGALTPLLQMKDVKSISTGSNVEIGEQIGTSGGRVMRRTTGQIKNEASWTLYHSGYHALVRAIKTAAPLRGNQRLISLVHFDITYQWTPPGSIDIFETRLLGCRIAGRTLANAEGVDATEIELPLSIGSLVDIIDGEEIVLL